MKRKHHLTRQRRRYPRACVQRAVAERVRQRLGAGFGTPVYEVVESRMKAAYQSLGAFLAGQLYSRPRRLEVLGTAGLTAQDFDFQAKPMPVNITLMKEEIEVYTEV